MLSIGMEIFTSSYPKKNSFLISFYLLNYLPQQWESLFLMFFSWVKFDKIEKRHFFLNFNRFTNKLLLFIRSFTMNFCLYNRTFCFASSSNVILPREWSKRASHNLHVIFASIFSSVNNLLCFGWLFMYPEYKIHETLMHKDSWLDDK